MADRNVEETDVINGRLGKYGVTRKSLYSIASVLICILLVVVLSLVQAAFDVNKLATVGFWIEFVILAGFSIFGMIGGQRTSDDVQRNKPDGAFRKTLKKFLGILNFITGNAIFAFLDDWLIFYRERKLKVKTEAFLKGLGIKQMEVLDLDLTELDNLSNPYKKDWSNTLYKGKYKDDTTYFLSLSEEQIEAVKFVFAGGVKVSNLNSTYFTTAVNLTDRDMWESAAKQDQKKGSYILVNYSYRLVMLLVLCVVSTALTSGMFEETVAETVLTLVKRIFCIMTAYVWGIFIGNQIVKIDLAYLEFKISILQLYKTECESGLYKHVDIDTMAKQEYELQQEQLIETIEERGEENGESEL